MEHVRSVWIAVAFAVGCVAAGARSSLADERSVEGLMQLGAEHQSREGASRERLEERTPDWNVLDVFDSRFGSGGSAGRGAGAGSQAGSISERIVLSVAEIEIEPGNTSSLFYYLRDNLTPIFGYSLDIELVPEPGATGEISVVLESTSFFEEQHVIVAGGAALDPEFSLILPTVSGVFASANTDDGSTVLAIDGVNDVLLRATFAASPDASGTFLISLGDATALSDGEGFAIDFLYEGGIVNVGDSGTEDPDLNDDGIVDVTDLLILLSDWGTCPILPPDINVDGVVDLSDLLLLLGAWGPCVGCPADFNLDGTVGITDLITLLGDWGEQSPPCADLDGDGFVDVGDLLLLLAAWS